MVRDANGTRVCLNESSTPGAQPRETMRLEMPVQRRWRQPREPNRGGRASKADEATVCRPDANQRTYHIQIPPTPYERDRWAFCFKSCDFLLSKFRCPFVFCGELSAYRQLLFFTPFSSGAQDIVSWACLYRNVSLRPVTARLKSTVAYEAGCFHPFLGVMECPEKAITAVPYC